MGGHPTPRTFLESHYILLSKSIRFSEGSINILDTVFMSLLALSCISNFWNRVPIWEVNQIRVTYCILRSFVTEKSYNMNDNHLSYIVPFWF
jgi:uncharacterized membrane protein